MLQQMCSRCFRNSGKYSPLVLVWCVYVYIHTYKHMYVYIHTYEERVWRHWQAVLNFTFEADWLQRTEQWEKWKNYERKLSVNSAFLKTCMSVALWPFAPRSSGPVLSICLLEGVRHSRHSHLHWMSFPPTSDCRCQKLLERSIGEYNRRACRGKLSLTIPKGCG